MDHHAGFSLPVEIGDLGESSDHVFCNVVSAFRSDHSNALLEILGRHELLDNIGRGVVVFGLKVAVADKCLRKATFSCLEISL